MFKEFLKMTFKSIFQHKKQSSVAIVSMCSVLVCYTVFEGYKLNIHYLFSKVYEHKLMYGDLIIEHKNKIESQLTENLLTTEDQNTIYNVLAKHSNLINAKTAHLFFQAQISTGLGQYIVFINSSDLQESQTMKTQPYIWDVFYGSPLNNKSSSILISYALSQKLNCRYEQDISSIIKQNATIKSGVREFSCPEMNFQISNVTRNGQLNVASIPVSGVFDGIYEELDDKMIQMPLELAQKIFGEPVVSKISVQTKNEKSTKTLQNFLQSELPQYKVTPWFKHEVGSIYKKTMSLFNLFSQFVLIILSTISFFIIFNTLFKVLLERQREFGLFLSIGYKKKHLYFLSFLEGQFLVITSAIIGIVVYYFINVCLNALELKYQAGLLSRSIILSLDFPFEKAVFAFIGLALLNAILTFFFMFIFLKKKIIDLLKT